METGPLTLMKFSELAPAGPIIVLALAGMILLAADAFASRANKILQPGLALAGLAAAFAALWAAGPPGAEPMTAFSACLRIDKLAYIAHHAILGSSVFLVLVSPVYLSGRAIPRGEYYALLLFATMGMLALAASNELLTLFLNLEILSFALYALAGIEKENLRSTEAAFKYFLTGSYAAAFLLFGIVMIFGALGTTNLGEIEKALAAGQAPGAIDPRVFMTAGLALMLVGFGFKLALAPFHMYAPDVYAGAPTPVAGLIATGSKTASAVALFGVLRAFSQSHELPPGFYLALCGLAFASLLVGGVGAVVQPNLKRLLAYSGISNSGFVLIPMIAMLKSPSLLPEAESATAYFIVAYALMTALAFGVACSLGQLGEGSIDRLAGLSRRSGFLAAALALALLSLIGIPPTAGFFAKYNALSVAVDAELYGLAIVGVLASVASAYYYLRVAVKMYMEDAPKGKEGSIPLESPNVIALLGASALVFLFAIFPALALLD